MPVTPADCATDITRNKWVSSHGRVPLPTTNESDAHRLTQPRNGRSAHKKPQAYQPKQRALIEDHVNKRFTLRTGAAASS